MTTAFYCVSDSRYFLGAVGLINSLRLQGHAEPIHLLDCGLTADQRALIADEVVLVDAPDDTPPYLLKTIAPLAHPAEVMVLIDVDMIATRNLGELIETAREGRVVAFENNVDRFVPEWGELLELGKARRRPYVSSSLVACGGRLGAEVLDLLDDRQRRVDFDSTFYGSNAPGYPFLYPEQDVLNAILATRPDQSKLVAFEHRLAPTQPFEGLSLASEATLACEYADGARPFVLHHYLEKPWLRPMYHGIYSRLLSRLLLGPDVAVAVPAEAMPLRMRQGPLAWANRKLVDVWDLARWRGRDLIPKAALERADERQRRRVAAGR